MPCSVEVRAPAPEPPACGLQRPGGPGRPRRRSGPDGGRRLADSGSFISAARQSIKTNWVISMPPGRANNPTSDRTAWQGQRAGIVLDLGVESGVGRLVRRDPASVRGGRRRDGGSTYWQGTQVRWCSTSCCRC